MAFSQTVKMDLDMAVGTTGRQRLFIARGNPSTVFTLFDGVTHANPGMVQRSCTQCEDNGYVTFASLYSAHEGRPAIGNYRSRFIRTDVALFFEKLRQFLESAPIAALDKISVSESYGNLTIQIGYWEPPKEVGHADAD